MPEQPREASEKIGPQRAAPKSIQAIKAEVSQRRAEAIDAIAGGVIEHLRAANTQLTNELREAREENAILAEDALRALTFDIEVGQVYPDLVSYCEERIAAIKANDGALTRQLYELWFVRHHREQAEKLRAKEVEIGRLREAAGELLSSATIFAIGKNSEPTGFVVCPQKFRELAALAPAPVNTTNETLTERRVP